MGKDRRDACFTRIGGEFFAQSALLGCEAERMRRSLFIIHHLSFIIYHSICMMQTFRWMNDFGGD